MPSKKKSAPSWTNTASAALPATAPTANPPPRPPTAPRHPTRPAHLTPRPHCGRQSQTSTSEPSSRCLGLSARSSEEGEDLGAVFGDGDGVFRVGASGPIRGAEGPAVVVDDVGAARAAPEPGFDREHVPSAQLQATTRAAAVGYMRVLVHAPTDPVTAEVEVGADARVLADAPDRGPDVAEPVPGNRGRDPCGQRLLGGSDQLQILGARCAHGEADRGVRTPAVDRGAAVDIQQVAVLELQVGRQPMQYGVVDRRTDDAAERAGREPRLVA